MAVQKVMYLHMCYVSSISRLQEHREIMQSWRLFWILCSLRWLKPKRKRVKNFNPIGSNILYTLLSRGRMNDNSLLLNIEIDSEFLIVSSNLYQSFRVEGRKEFLKQSVRQWKAGIRFNLVLVVSWIFGIKLLNN